MIHRLIPTPWVRELLLCSLVCLLGLSFCAAMAAMG
jgi:hypothetical protein